jgi:hypothetical protein
LSMLKEILRQLWLLVLVMGRTVGWRRCCGGCLMVEKIRKEKGASPKVLWALEAGDWIPCCYGLLEKLAPMMIIQRVGNKGGKSI